MICPYTCMEKIDDFINSLQELSNGTPIYGFPTHPVMRMLEFKRCNGVAHSFPRITLVLHNDFGCFIHVW